MKTQICSPTGIPMPIVTLNRSIIVACSVFALATQQPLITTALFAVLLPASLFGRRASLIYGLGQRLLAQQIAKPNVIFEDAQTQRFNNIIATLLLAFAQIAFFVQNMVLGWLFIGMILVAASVALLGFCIGCFIYFQFRLNRYRLINWMTK